MWICTHVTLIQHPYKLKFPFLPRPIMELITYMNWSSISPYPFSFTYFLIFLTTILIIYWASGSWVTFYITHPANSRWTFFHSQKLSRLASSLQLSWHLSLTTLWSTEQGFLKWAQKSSKQDLLPFGKREDSSISAPHARYSSSLSSIQWWYHKISPRCWGMLLQIILVIYLFCVSQW